MFLRNGAGAFDTVYLYSQGYQQLGLVNAADLNGDGKLDVVFMSFSPFSSEVVTMLGNGDGTLGPPLSQTLISGVAPISAFIADISGDGKPDLLLAV
jgi:hypothetical protein